jgi:hypothetical protein
MPAQTSKFFTAETWGKNEKEDQFFSLCQIQMPSLYLSSSSSLLFPRADLTLPDFGEEELR